jgi:thioredoxin-related protein
MKLKTATVHLLIICLLAAFGFAEETQNKANGTKESNGAQEAQTVQENPTEIQWHQFDEGLKLAKEEGKNVLIEFYTDWCGYCKKMNKTTFKDPGIIGMINDNYVPVRVNGDSRDTVNLDGWITSERNLTRSEYGVTGYPTYVFLEPDGGKITKLPGYQQSDRLLTILDYLKDDAFKTVTFQEFISGKSTASKDEKP